MILKCFLSKAMCVISGPSPPHPQVGVLSV